MNTVVEKNDLQKITCDFIHMVSNSLVCVCVYTQRENDIDKYIET